MIDIHTHVLFGLDDGAQSLEESMAIIHKYIENGYHGVVATPHHYNGKYLPSKEAIIESRQTILNELKAQNIDFEIHLGNEIFLDDKTLHELENNEVFTLADSKYVLIEFPFLGKVNYAPSLIYQIQLSGYIPVLAHVERYQVTKEEFDFIEKIYKAGALFQINLSSLKNESSQEYKMANKLLDKDMVQIVGTDTHSPERRNPDVKKQLDYLRKKMGEGWYSEVAIENPQKIINDEFIRKTEIVEEIPKIKKEPFWKKILRRNKNEK
ncbi:MAG: CpsB/CapC family capsule biosynthesis tyrosine phosphatase [Finegoldia magna]|nr:CpsB/CapC family capsule biosynthesis tyrosine phosphatase [Finegoldia magna]